METLQNGRIRAAVALLLLPLVVAAFFLREGTVDAGDKVTLTPDADSYVSADLPTTNFGTSTALRADAAPDVHAYLQFSVSGLNKQSPTQAVLQLYARSASVAGVTVRAVADNTWGETTLDYANMPSLGATLSNSGALTANTWTNLDVTSVVKADGTYSFAITTPGATNVNLASRESGANAPRLVLTLRHKSAKATPTATTAPTLAPTDTALPPANATTPLTSSSIKHVFIIVMENKGYPQVWNSKSTPYITSLGKAYVRSTNFHAITHPSLPNYLDLYAGSNYGITTDCPPSSTCHTNARNLADNLSSSGLTWRGYMESMPSPCYLATSGYYAPKHNPFVYFDDIRKNATRCKDHVVPLSALAADLSSAATTPNFAFITPNECDDMHSCPISTGDTWLQKRVPSILSSAACVEEKCLVVITWDEDNGNYGNHVLTIFAGSGAKTGGVVSTQPYNLYSILRTVEGIFGLPTLTTHDATASPMTDMLQ